MESELYSEEDLVQACTNGENVAVNQSFDVVTENMDYSDLTPNIEMENTRPEKRSREETSSDEGWNTVSRVRKIIRRSSQIEEKTHVCVTSAEVLPKQFALARLLKENNIKNISRVKYVHPYKIIIMFDEDICAEEFINCQSFVNLGWRCQKTSEVGISYGVIKDVEMDFPEKDIIGNLFSSVEIISAKRLSKRNSDETSSTAWITSESVRLGFRGSLLPTYVAIQGMKVKVEPYVFPVTQCSRCWKYGHSLRMCPSKKVVCPKCSKGHANCESLTFRCVNCIGNHMALQRVCPIYKKERRVRELMAEFNCTYRKALSMYVPPSPVPERDMSPFTASQFPNLTQNDPVPTPPPETSEPERSEKLMSELFGGTDDVTSKTAPLSRKKQKKQRQPPRAPTPLPPEVPMETNSSTDDRTDTARNNSEVTAESVNRKKDLGFMRLIIRVKNIVMSEESLENKIRQVVSTFTEWILSKVVGNISISSLMSTFMNVVINEYG